MLFHRSISTSSIVKMSSVTSGSPKRVIVVGAGWAGLVAAKTYLELDPNIDLTIIDSERTLGGVWSSDRIYPGLTTDSPVGLFDYSDLPMGAALGLKDWDDLPAQKVYEYLYKYSEKFSLLKHMRLSTTVTNISKHDGSKEWNVAIQPSGEVLMCDKLLVATGLASKPRWPDIPRDNFTCLVMHSKEIGARHTELASEKVRRVTVYGGSKSAVDAIILCTSVGKKVDWVIRETGNGAGMMVQVRKNGKHGALLMGRWKAFISPSLFVSTGFWYNFLHSGKNRLGAWLRKQMWAKMGTAPFGMEPYKTKSANMQKLKPEVPHAMWQTATPNALHGNEDFLTKLHGGEDIHVHRASITSMSDSDVILSDGTVLQSDAAIFATGWDLGTTIFDTSTALDLGLPAPIDAEDESETKYWQELDAKAEAELLSKYPLLQTAPNFHKAKLNYTSFRLYKSMIPHSLAATHDRSLIFLGMLSNLQYAMYSEISALWGISWMEGLLREECVPNSKTEIDYDIARFNCWSAHRYLSRGRTRMVAGGEIQDIIDSLVRDLELDVHRRKNWLTDTFVPYRSQLYEGIVKEVLARTKGTSGADR
ncbi:flavin-binding monooxygenase-like protein [Phlyctema vagabunda]|uniref:Flavin-binding monooxygenase-like protein n=1 Tax=Phlyctema vagabunda TaxID=108571 RepID=A0ABR4PK18_9HELO